MTTQDTIRDRFPHPNLTPISGIPTYEGLHIIQIELNANASSIPSLLGNVQLGHLGLTITAQEYNALSDKPFTAPENPGSSPQFMSKSSGAEISNYNATFNATTKLFSYYLSTDQDLKQLLLAAVDDIYVSATKHATTGYSSVTTLYLLQHLFQTYSNITSVELEENDCRLHSPFDPSTPLENLFQQIDSARDFSQAANIPYYDLQLTNIAFTLLLQCVKFNHACRLWREDPTRTTYSQLRTHFIEANKDLLQEPVTSEGAGFHTSNSSLRDIEVQTQAAIQRVNNTTSHDRTHLAQLQ